MKTTQSLGSQRTAHAAANRILPRPLPYCRVTLAAALVLGVAPAAPALAATPSKHPAPASQVHHHKPKHKAHAPVTAPAVSSTAAGLASTVNCPDAWLQPSPANVDRIATATLCMVNQLRAAAGLPPLRLLASMTAAATAHSIDMVEGNYLSDVSPSGSNPLTRLSAVGYVKATTDFDIAENLAAASGPAGTPAATVALWMTDAGTRANILSPTYRDTGIGVIAAAAAAGGLAQGVTFTEDFGLKS